MGKAAHNTGKNREAEPATMRGVTRTLAVVRTLNENNRARVSELARLTRIPRPSLYRILDALCSLGYLRRTDEERYELTLLVRTLSDGFSDEPWVRVIAEPIMEELQREIVWPTDMATFYGNAMYLRATTRRHSPLTIDAATVGLRLPMLQSATGRAYLAFCSDAEREAILVNLRRSKAPEDRRARDANHVREIVAITRKKGYGERHRQIFDKTGAIAVPIRRGPQVLACLNISFIASALSPGEAALRYLGQLQDAAMLIEQRLAAQE
jgi:IclR family transcriptional regulator, mhp operon transcriptional activator